MVRRFSSAWTAEHDVTEDSRRGEAQELDAGPTPRKTWFPVVVRQSAGGSCLKVADLLFELFYALEDSHQRVALRVRQSLEAPLTIRSVAGARGTSRYADRCRSRWYVAEHDRASTNLGAIPNVHIAQYLRADADDDVIANRRVAFATMLAGTAERDTLVHRDVLANDGRFTNHHAHAVIDEEPGPERRSRMDLDPGQETRRVGDQSGQESLVATMEGMGHSMKLDRVKTRVGEDDFCCRASRGITLQDCRHVISIARHRDPRLMSAPELPKQAPPSLVSPFPTSLDRCLSSRPSPSPKV